MSESELSDAPAIPSDSALEKSLRQAIREAVKDEKEVTVNAIRTSSEQDLRLEAGYYKSHPTWKQKSKHIIQDEFSKTESGGPEPSPKKPTSKPKAGKPKTEKLAKKRSSSAAQNARPRKKRRTSTSDDDDDDNNNDDGSEPVSSASDSENDNYDDDDDVVGGAARGPAKRKKNLRNDSTKSKANAKARVETKQPTSQESDQEDKDTPNRVGKGGVVEANDRVVQNLDDESALSDVIDELPSKQRKKSSSTSLIPKSNGASTKPKAKSKAADDDPDVSQIRLLQSQLAKCGIRKVWGKELKRFETPREKIRHLKSMLSDVGMTGRFSEEKARQIKEERELQADLEAVQEGNEAWGIDEDAESAGEGGKNGAATKSSRGRLIRGAKTYDFLSDDGEETD